MHASRPLSLCYVRPPPHETIARRQWTSHGVIQEARMPPIPYADRLVESSDGLHRPSVADVDARIQRDSAGRCASLQDGPLSIAVVASAQPSYRMDGRVSAARMVDTIGTV
jgi:hypothetical protein